MSPTLLVLGAGPFQAPAIRRAREMGFRVAATDGNPRAVGLALADFAYAVDLKDIEGCLRIARERQVCGVLSLAAEVAVRTVAEVASALGLPGCSPEAARVATDKSLMRSRFAERGVPSARSLPCRTLDEARTAAAALGLPVVVKPADNAGSRGVALVTGDDETPGAFAAALAASPAGLVLVEEFMAGQELSVEGFAHDGRFHVLALSDKIRSPPPALVDTTVLFPSEQPPEIQRRAREVAAQAVAAAGIDGAAIHIEQIVTADGPRMVELAARGAGFRVFDTMIPWVTGVDAVEQLIRIAAGRRPDLGVRHQRGAVLRFPESTPGRVRAVGGLDEARRLVADLEIYLRPGDTVRPLRSGADRIGYLLALGETRGDAVTAVRSAEAALRIEVESQAA